MRPTFVQSPYEAALDFLVGRIDYERTPTVPYQDLEFRLQRMRKLLARLGDPHLSLKAVHVAGTKGKGSMSAMTAAILSAAGYRTGLYSSPHLNRIEERFVLDGQICSEAKFVELVEQIRPVVERIDREAVDPSDKPTYFEVTTAVAMLYFAEARVDAAVLEVGLGGRLDSTNVCVPEVSVITSISFDHMKQLGNTLGAIAREKAGIIKPRVPVVSGVTAPEAQNVIRSVARLHECTLSELNRDFSYTYHPPESVEQAPVLSSMDFQYEGPARPQHYSNLMLGLLGRHQGANAAVAIATIAELQKLGWSIGEGPIRQGLRNVRWPARIEVVSRSPLVIVDAAHNVASIESLLETLRESTSVRRKVLIFATTHEKDIAGMLHCLLPEFDEVIFTKYSINPRGIPADELAQIAAAVSDRPVYRCRNASAAWSLASSLAAPTDLICITGSFFLAAELRAEFLASASPVVQA